MTVERVIPSFTIPSLTRAISFARVRCIPRREVIERCLVGDIDNFDPYIHRLRELGLTIGEQKVLVKTMKKKAVETEKLTLDDRETTDKAILHLVRLVSQPLTAEFAQRYLSHRHKGRRRWAYAALRDTRLSIENATQLVSVFRKTRDRETLPLIVQSPECVRMMGADFLLEQLARSDQRFLRGRILQVLLTYDRDSALSKAEELPWEFVYAAGRAEDATLLATLRSLFVKNSNDTEFLGIYVWALGKLGAREDVESFENFVKENAKAMPAYL
jgi:hypothetical protein